MAFSTKNKKSVTYVTEERFNSEIKNINNAIINRSSIKECTISNPKSIQFSSYKTLQEANMDIENRHLGELIYIESTMSLYQVSKNGEIFFYDKLIKNSEYEKFVTAKCTDISGQAFYNNKETKVLFTEIELDNSNMVNLERQNITIKHDGIYSIDINLVLELVKELDTVLKFGFYKNKKFINITKYFLKNDGKGYLAGNFEGYLEKDTELEFILEIKCNKFLYLSHKPGLNFINIKSTRLGSFYD